jgi:Tol biopolymer transport system component
LCLAAIATATTVSSRVTIVVEAQVPAMRWDGLIELVSGRNQYPPPTMDPPTPADGPSQMSRHAVSGDGRYVVFTANAPALGYYGQALYLRDRRLSDTRLIFAAASGNLRDAVISEDGRHVAFTICEGWMRPDQAPICDVWAIDMLTFAWSPLSIEPLQGELGNADSDEPVLSANGRFVVFRTAATNLAPGVPAGVPQLVIRDRDQDGNGIYDEPGPNTFQIVSAPKGASGSVPGNGPSATADVSEDGRYIAFRSAASNLVPGDTNGAWDVFRRDRLARDTRRLNRGRATSVPNPIDPRGSDDATAATSRSRQPIRCSRPVVRRRQRSGRVRVRRAVFESAAHRCRLPTPPACVPGATPPSGRR